MSYILTQVDAWATAAALLVAMLAAWAGGAWMGRRQKEADGEAAGKGAEASLALLGLMLAFTFSMSLGKHDQRRIMVVTDSNAIGDFLTCVNLVKGPVSEKLEGVLRGYVEHRLALAKPRLSNVEIQQAFDRIDQMHAAMQGLVREAVDSGTPVTVPLINTFNGVTSNTAARLAAVRDRLPASVVVVLFVAALLSMVLLGRQQGASDRYPVVGVVGFVALVCMVVWVILDLNQPQYGWITVSQEPLERLLAGMRKS
ncbi:MAG: hypothetical protein L0Y71_21045 [Gemmataceae bacterium]|nr:hypothetical protein [Gemmataceae bacterium]